MLDENTGNDPLEWTEADQAAMDAQISGDEPEPEASQEEQPVIEEPETGQSEPDDDDEQDDEPEQGKRPGFVPHRKLHKALEKAKKIEAELAKEREERVRLEERTNMILQRLQQPQPQAQQPAQPEPPPPNPEDDIFGAVQHQSKTLEQLRQEIEARKRAEEDQARINNIVVVANQHVEKFKATVPDYTEAYAHLRQSRISELEMLGYAPQQIQQLLLNEEVSIAARALQAGKNPGEVIYNLAKTRGYARKEEPKPEDVGEKLARQAEAQSRSTTLSHGGGAAAPAKLDARTVARMSEEEFAALMAKSPKALEQLMMG